MLFTSLAETDLERIGDYIALDNPTRALAFIQEIRVQCRKVGKSPLSYRARPELGDGIRSCPFGNYVILYRPDAPDALIIRVLRASIQCFGRSAMRLLPDASLNRRHNSVRRPGFISFWPGRRPLPHRLASRWTSE